MTTQEKWEAEVAKVDRLTRFNKNGNAILLVGGVAIIFLVLLLYHGLVTPIKIDNLAGIKTIVVAVLLGFGASSAASGMISSIYAGSVNVKILSNPPRADDYRKVKQLLPKLEEAKEVMKHYFQISAVILFLTVLKDIIGLFIV